jgi:cell wall-associated NlpC family hydrolase
MQSSNSFLVVCAAAAACVVVSCAHQTGARAKAQAPQAPQAQAEVKPGAETTGRAAAQETNAQTKAQAPQAPQPQAEANPKAETPGNAAAQARADKAAQAQAKADREKGKASLAKGPLTFRPIEAPPLPISAEKQQALSDLLAKYKADEVTPEQYHEQRAKILAGP